MSHQEETHKKTQKMQEELGYLAGLGTPQDFLTSDKWKMMDGRMDSSIKKHGLCLRLKNTKEDPFIESRPN